VIENGGCDDGLYSSDCGDNSKASNSIEAVKEYMNEKQHDSFQHPTNLCVEQSL
jgi:hypothetical protein